MAFLAPGLGYAFRDAADWLTTLADGGPDLLTNAHLKVPIEAKEFADDPVLEEWADVFMCLVGSATKRGWTEYQCAAAVLEKVHKNRGRTWVERPDGTWQHVEDEA